MRGQVAVACAPLDGRVAPIRRSHLWLRRRLRPRLRPHVHLRLHPRLHPRLQSRLRRRGASSLIHFDNFTETPSLSAPAAGVTVKNNFDVSFVIPETACSGCVTLLFTRTGGTADAHGGTHTLTLASTYEAAGSYTISALSYNISSAPAADVVSTLPAGTK